MESQEQGNSLRSRIAMMFMAGMVIHVMLCLYVIFVPLSHLPKNKIVNLYQQLFVLGPFFAEARIKSSHSLSVRYKSAGRWSNPREFVNENFLVFSTNPLRVDKLPFNDYEKRLSHSVGNAAQKNSFEAVGKSTAFRELNEFIVKDCIGVPVDSIHMVYGWDQYDPVTKKFKLDTAFNYTYNPATIARAKK